MFRLFNYFLGFKICLMIFNNFKVFLWNLKKVSTRIGHNFLYKDRFFMIFTPFQSPDSQLSNGAFRMKKVMIDSSRFS